MTKAYYLANRERIIARAKKHYEENKHKRKRQIRNTFLKMEYGITVDDYEKLLETQNGVCAICQQPPNNNPKRRQPRVRPQRLLVVDHCHETGKVRGLLCNRCNTGLWGLEAAEWRKKAEAYLAL